MKKIASLSLLALTSILFLPTAFKSAGTALGQKKRGECVQAARKERSRDKVGQDYVYMDYVLCSPGMEPPNPLVRVWMTTRVEQADVAKWGPSRDGADLQINVERWSAGRDGADLVSVSHGGKTAYTLYRDLDAVPLQLFKAERRAAVPTEMAGQPFVREGGTLIPLENLTPESAERVRKVFEDADALVRLAQRKTTLNQDSKRISGMVESLKDPPKGQD